MSVCYRPISSHALESLLWRSLLLYASRAMRNFRRWRILGRNVWPNAYVGRTFDDEISFLKQWVQQRIEWMDRQFISPPSFSIQVGAISRGTKLEVRSRKGQIYYTVDGTDPRALGGAPSPSAKPYKSGIVLNETAKTLIAQHEVRTPSFFGLLAP